MEQAVYYITRHGMRLDWEQPDWHVGSGEKAYDTPLSKEGLQQAHELGKHLAELDQLDYIFSSPFLRCVQTADAVAAAQEQNGGAVPIFIENALGEWDAEELISGRLESVHDLHVRCERFVEFIDAHKDYAGRGKRILFVGHAASTIAFYRALMRDHTADFYPATCSLTKLVISSEPEETSVPPRRQRPEVTLWGDCTHLSSGQQRPWRFTTQHDQELVEARVARPNTE